MESITKQEFSFSGRITEAFEYLKKTFESEGKKLDKKIFITQIIGVPYQTGSKWWKNVKKIRDVETLRPLEEFGIDIYYFDHTKHEGRSLLKGSLQGEATILEKIEEMNERLSRMEESQREVKDTVNQLPDLFSALTGLIKRLVQAVTKG